MLGVFRLHLDEVFGGWMCLEGMRSGAIGYGDWNWTYRDWNWSHAEDRVDFRGFYAAFDSLDEVGHCGER